jgi:integrase
VEPKNEITVAELVDRWAAARRSRVLPFALHQQAVIGRYVLPLIGTLRVSELTHSIVKSWVERLCATRSRAGGRLARRTVRKTLALWRQVLKWGAAHDVPGAEQACAMRVRVPANADKSSGWRIRARFSPDESRALLVDERLPLASRVRSALYLLAGLRLGEASALKWGDYDATTKPLGTLACRASYSSGLGRVGPTRIGSPRNVPVHPLLADLLSDWFQSGWTKWVGRAPSASELIVPAPDGDVLRAVTASRQFRRQLKLLGLSPRRVHDARRTFICLAIEGGASSEIVGLIVGRHLRPWWRWMSMPAWEEMCSAVLCVLLALPGAGREK